MKTRGQRRSLQPTNPCSEPGCTSLAGHYRVAGKLYCRLHGPSKRVANAVAKKSQGLAKTGKTLPFLLPRSYLPTTYKWQDQTINLRKRPQIKNYDTSPDWALACQNWIRAGADFFKDIILMKNRRKLPPEWTKDERIGRSYIAFVEHFLVTPGMDQSQPFIMSEYCREYFIKAFTTLPKNDQMIKYRSACIMSVAKKNKKTTSLSSILAAQILIAPWPDMKIVVGAPTKVGSESYGMTRMWLERTPGCTTKTLGVGGDIPPLITWTTSSKEELSMRRNPKAYPSEYAAELISVSEQTTQQLSSAPRGCATLDELGRLPDDKMFNALRDSLRAAALSPLLVISIRGNEDSPLVTILKEQQEDPDPNMYVKEYSGANAATPYCDEAILAANPTIGEPGGPLIEDLRAQMKRAQKPGGEKANYFRETLNMAANIYVEKPLLTEHELDLGREKPVIEGPVVLGLDLGLSGDAAALSLYDPQTGGLESHIFLPGEPSLDVRGQADRIPYVLWQDTGRLHLAADSWLISYESIIYMIDSVVVRYGAEEMYVDPHLYSIFEKTVKQIAKKEPELRKRWPNVFPVICSAGNMRGDNVHISSFVDRFQERARSKMLIHGEDPIFMHALARSVLRANHVRQYSVAKNTANAVAACNDSAVAALLCVGGREAFENASTPVPTLKHFKHKKYFASLPSPAVPETNDAEEEADTMDLGAAIRAGVADYRRERAA